MVLAFPAGLALAFDTGAVQPQLDTPVVAVVARGQLMPLASHDGSKWNNFDWPEVAPGDVLPAVPKAAVDTPSTWFAPLSRLPTTWQLRLVNEQSQAVQLGAPARWEDAWFDSIGFRIAVPSGKPIDEEFATGIAGVGGVVLLPVKSLDGSSPAWSTIVERHISAFAAAERRAAVRPPVSVAKLRSQLTKGKVSLWVVEESEALSYLYFTTFLIRGRGCDNSFAEHVGMIEQRRGGNQRLVWIRAEGLGCDSHGSGLDIPGAVSVNNETRFIVKGGETSEFLYALVDPRSPGLVPGR